MSPIGEIAKETHARELVGLAPAVAVEVYAKALEATNGNVTAAAINSAKKKVDQPIVIPRTRRRRPLPAAYRDAMWPVEKTVATLKRLTADNRFAGHREELRRLYDFKTSTVELDLMDIEHRLGCVDSDCEECAELTAH